MYMQGHVRKKEQCLLQAEAGHAIRAQGAIELVYYQLTLRLADACAATKQSSHM
jgi:hypothetical protein